MFGSTTRLGLATRRERKTAAATAAHAAHAALADLPDDAPFSREVDDRAMAVATLALVDYSRPEKVWMAQSVGVGDVRLAVGALIRPPATSSVGDVRALLRGFSN